MISISEGLEMERERRMQVSEPSIPAAVTPQDAAKINDSKDHAAVVANVAKINASLKSSFSTGGTVTICSSHVGNGKVGQAVEAHFRKAGWKIQRISDQRDGDYYTFSA